MNLSEKQPSSALGRSRIFNMRPASSPQPNRVIRPAALDWDLLWEKFGIAAVLLLVWILAALATPRFANLDNLASVLRQSAFVGIAAVGMTMAIIAGTFDLSVGSTRL
jgi:ABC-type xylose transport system permease subunit